MSVTIFSSTGCIRCQIVKNYLQQKDIPFEEHNIKTPEGNTVFKAFYRENRHAVRRDGDGIFFPIVADGEHIVQDAGATLAWFVCGNKLDAAVTPNNLGHGWIGGLDISACDSENAPFFLEILRCLKAGGLATSLSTNGGNAGLLESVFTEKLADKLEFSLSGSAENIPELTASLVAFRNHAGNIETAFTLDICGPDGMISPADAAVVADRMAESTGNNRLPLRIINSSPDRGTNLFPYRTEARRWQVLTELA